MMHNKEDFFSPEMVDERLDLSLSQRDMDTPALAADDPNLLLISDLRYLYGAEGTENVRSLQRVWEHLKDPSVKEALNATPPLPEVERGHYLHLLKPVEEKMSQKIKRRNRLVHGRAQAVLAAVLFLVVMVGSLLTIVHLTRMAQADGSGPALTPQPTAVQPASIPGYLYAPPGRDLALSPPSSATFDALSWSPDGKQLALSTQSKIWLWDVPTNQYRPLLDAQLAGSSVKALAWSPNGRYLAVGSNPIQIVNPINGNVIGTYSADYPILPVPGQPTLVTALAWSPDGTMLAMATQHTNALCYVFVWNMLTGTGINTFTQQGSASGISSVSWSGDNRYVASSDGQTVQAWDIRNPSNVIFKHAVDAATNAAWSPTWSPNYGWLAFVSNKTTQVWNVWNTAPNSVPVSSYPASNGVLSWSPKGNYLATADKNTVAIFNASTSIHIYTYSGDTHYVNTLAWSPDGNSIATGESGSPGPHYARVWSA
jgi:Tol biopolymer transport system component